MLISCGSSTPGLKYYNLGYDSCELMHVINDCLAGLSDPELITSVSDCRTKYTSDRFPVAR